MDAKANASYSTVARNRLSIQATQVYGNLLIGTFQAQPSIAVFIYVTVSEVYLSRRHTVVGPGRSATSWGDR